MLPLPFHHRRGGQLLVLLVAALSVPGCGDKEVEKAVAKATKSVATAVDSVTRPEINSGFALDLGGPLRTSKALATLIIVGDGQPNILEIASHDDGPVEHFPSVYVRGETTAKTLGGLNGKTIPVQFYGQTQLGGPIWYTPQEPVQLSITSATTYQLEGKISPCQLTEVATGEQRDIPIKFVAEIP